MHRFVLKTRLAHAKTPDAHLPQPDKREDLISNQRASGCHFVAHQACRD
jgi:hypothetical protein